jgi:hypothetical protein
MEICRRLLQRRRRYSYNLPTLIALRAVDQQQDDHKTSLTYQDEPNASSEASARNHDLNKDSMSPGGRRHTRTHCCMAWIYLSRHYLRRRLMSRISENCTREIRPRLAVLPEAAVSETIRMRCTCRLSTFSMCVLHSTLSPDWRGLFHRQQKDQQPLSSSPLHPMHSHPACFP